MSSRERVIPDACELIKFNNVIEKSFLSLSLVCEKKVGSCSCSFRRSFSARICLLDYHTHHRQASGTATRSERLSIFAFSVNK